MRRFLRRLLLKPVLWATSKFSSKPDRAKIFRALDKLYEHILSEPPKKGVVIPFDINAGKFIIFSDQHKGGRDGADDFTLAEPNYLAALDHYYRNGFVFISMGDSEELWENTLSKVKKHNQATFDAERKFAAQQRFVKVFGNHDLYWDNDPIAWWHLKRIYKQEIKIYEGVVLKTNVNGKALHIFCTHGHQGDASSDGNWFSKWFVANIWAPLQAYLRINPNTPAYDGEKKTLHNDIMYEWSSKQKDLLLVTGHTHQPVFASLTLLERLYKEFQLATEKNDSAAIAAIKEEIRKREKEFAAVSMDYMNMRPAYFNTGCCCFIDGDITGIEIADEEIRLIKWKKIKDGSERQVLERVALSTLIIHV
ncbi:MAG: metallophosphoesterase [Chitinophagaceae bacterium]|nr:metallophosphoesterase [Chitinophagaceae bacterium]